MATTDLVSFTTGTLRELHDRPAELGEFSSAEEFDAALDQALPSVLGECPPTLYLCPNGQ
ncbi:hypothetical protein [Streptomyces tsukubensis]|uniref:Uncharacterized protein n=1 Tax=Streptomyces tsukubensis TaxID=83656 RepID=A0A1V4A2I0_9ACTN|nr:hypothetical protein [Streptomyces tsukubensis]OON73453.1 hypothetical protein B1H18_27100 [Streptomyces tsukubensis]